MCFELKEQVTAIDEEKYDCSGTRERRYSGLPVSEIPGPSFSWSVKECAYDGRIFCAYKHPTEGIRSG